MKAENLARQNNINEATKKTQKNRNTSDNTNFNRNQGFQTK